MGTDSDFEYQLQALVGERIVPSSGLSGTEETRLTAAKRTLDQNYYELEGYIEGELATNPVFICHQDNKEDAGFEALRLLHNYLSSMYSFNETVRVLFNRCSPEKIELYRSDFAPTPGGTEESYYRRKLAFLRGLRTDFQHGGFSCLTFDKAGELGDFGGYHIVFERIAFIDESGLRDPERFLRHTNQNERRYPIAYIGQFHRETVQEFYDDVEAWFDAG